MTYAAQAVTGLPHLPAGLAHTCRSPTTPAPTSATPRGGCTWSRPLLVFVFLLVTTLIVIWFERRVIGRMQQRPGPNRTGPFGLLQTLADGVKLALKEDLTPKDADKIVFTLAPVIAGAMAFVSFAIIPLGPTVSMFGHRTPLQLTDIPVAVLLVLAVAGVGVYGIVLAGWSSGSTYPLLGGLRSTAQVISYEIAMGLSLVAVFLYAGSMSTSQIVDAQKDLWYIIPAFFSFFVYVITMVGETNRLPFDLAEGEGELTGGFHTEYSSLKFAMFFLGEYVNMFTVSALATTMFLGGWQAPPGIAAINDGMFNHGWWGLLWFVIKLWLFMFFFVWLRGSLPRVRYDQFMRFGWKFLIPVTLAWVVVVAFIRGSQLGYFGDAALTLGNGEFPVFSIVFVVISRSCALLAVAGCGTTRRSSGRRPTAPRRRRSTRSPVATRCRPCPASACKEPTLAIGDRARTRHRQGGRSWLTEQLIAQRTRRAGSSPTSSPRSAGSASPSPRCSASWRPRSTPRRSGRPQPRFHGRHQLNRHPDGLEKCVGCELCAWACPADAILVEGAHERRHRGRHRPVLARRALRPRLPDQLPALHLLRPVHRGLPDPRPDDDQLLRAGRQQPRRPHLHQGAAARARSRRACSRRRTRWSRAWRSATTTRARSPGRRPSRRHG